MTKEITVNGIINTAMFNVADIFNDLKEKVGASTKTGKVLAREVKKFTYAEPTNLTLQIAKEKVEALRAKQNPQIQK
ncbi:MAG TPA: hypothetical protein VKC53_03540 [Patescibacteria group bacterium]|nr:hypothetical protein [Patescibacteria group bacterium]